MILYTLQSLNDICLGAELLEPSLDVMVQCQKDLSHLNNIVPSFSVSKLCPFRIFCPNILLQAIAQ